MTGSDNSWKELKNWQLRKSIKGFRFRRNYGKAAALHTGFTEASGCIITMDSDLRTAPARYPLFQNDKRGRI